MRERVPALGVDRDEWTRRMMHWHFSAETGSRFWTAKRRSLPFDPLRDVVDFDSLRLFGLFDKNDIRGVRVRDLLPRGFADRTFRVFETGGTTGESCRIVDVTRSRYDVELYHAMMEERGLAGGDVLALVPSGPHAYGHFVARLAESWQGVALFVDFDPRWAREQQRDAGSAEDYVRHLVRQAASLLSSQSPALLFTTSRLLLALVQELPRPLASYRVRAVCTGGTCCTPEEERYVRERYLAHVPWIDTYGNTLMGHALQADPVEEGAPRSYHLPPPFAAMKVVDPANPWQQVDFGERGRILVVTLLEDLFLPNLLERDSALRVGPHPWFPWEGIAAVRPYADDAAAAVKDGVY
ncbi:hypothetical protein ACFU3E_23510 [Streptomyces sp. NPDC057424]|uniref:hypothetical protein n=1 Tax=Streptomyces sp. NPDC057424 TaxID=3346127 RepID=UPI0036D0EFFE